MNYNDSLKYIHSFLKFGSKPGLERVEKLCELNGNPQNSLRIVHIGGTNGKGSVSTMLSEILTLSGKKTALFTSPYITSFCERMRINSENIPKNKLASLTTKYKSHIEYLNEKGIFPTEFELITAMAFDYFRQEKCDIAVTEVGLGGLYDSTNIVKKPLVSVITHIAMDHTDVLGSTLEEITLQKCGIIKQGVPCVLYPQQEDSVFEKVKACCEEKNSPLIIPDMTELKIISTDVFGSVIEYKGRKIKIPLAGYHQILNCITAVQTAEILGVDFDDIVRGIEKTKIPARVEVINASPLVILDGGHNPDGAFALAESLKDAGRYVAVVSMMRDKDEDKALSFLLKNACAAISTKCSNPRAEDENILGEKCRKHCDRVLVEKNPRKAFNKAMELRKMDEAVVVCGSLYLAGEIREYLKNFFDKT